MMQGFAIRRPVDQQGAIHAHKLPGALGGSVCGENICKTDAEPPHSPTMDSTTAVAYINRMGGTHSSTLSNITCSLWQWCLQRAPGITLSAEHLPGIHNITADAESRTFHSSVEWQLVPSVFRGINTLLGPCQVDLFATRLNHQLPCYISWCPDPFSMSTDAFQGKWTGFLGYAFPSFALVGKCLQRVRREKSSLLIVAPVWSSQAWYPLLLQYLVKSPVLIPMYSNILQDPFGHLHPMVTQGPLQLAAWKASGRTRNFGKVFQAYTVRMEQRNNIILPVRLEKMELLV